jgi:hypothetical protein
LREKVFNREKHEKHEKKARGGECFWRREKKVEIKIEHNVSEEQLNELGVLDWPTWTKEPSKFPWRYDSAETCYFLDGEVTVTPKGGAPVKMGSGDLATFPAGMSCTWEIHKMVCKHYNFE